MGRDAIQTSGWRMDAELAGRVMEACERRRPRAWRLLESLVATDSSPDDLAGLNAVVGHAKEALEELDLTTSLERTAAGLPVLHAGKAPARPGAPRILMVGHLDTVFPAGTAAEWPLGVEGDRASGPGIADAKGGAVVAWLAVAAALDATDGLPGLDLRLLLNTDEEAGSVQSRPILEAQAPSTDLALIYEPGRPDGSIVRQRRGARRYRIDIEGRAAHTGVEPWSGVNAIEEAAHKVLALQALNNRERFLSVTVAVLHGGQRVNVVPDHATLDVDTRLPDLETAGATHAAVEAIVHQTYVEGASATYAILSDRPPMMPQPQVPKLISELRRAGRLLGVELVDTATGGGSDGCFLSPLGVPTIDALGPVGGGYHTRDEFVSVPTIAERAAVSALALAALSGGRG